MVSLIAAVGLAQAAGGLVGTVPEKLLLSLLCAVVKVIDQLVTLGVSFYVLLLLKVLH